VSAARAVPQKEIDDATDVSEAPRHHQASEVSSPKPIDDATDISEIPPPKVLLQGKSTSNSETPISLHSNDVTLPHLSQIGDSYRDEPTLNNTQDVDRFLKSMIPESSTSLPKGQSLETQSSSELLIPRLSDIGDSFRNEPTLHDTLEVDNLIKSGLAAVGITNYEELDEEADQTTNQISVRNMIPPREFATLQPLDGTPEDSQALMDSSRVSYIVPPRNFSTLLPLDGTPEDSQMIPHLPQDDDNDSDKTSVSDMPKKNPPKPPQKNQENTRVALKQTLIHLPKPPSKRPCPITKQTSRRGRETEFLKRRPMQSDIRSHLLSSSSSLSKKKRKQC